MAIVRTKNNVPQVYVSESRDFQIFTRVLDLVQNALKYDIDSMINIVSTDTISEEYLERLKSKLGFFTTNIYDDETLRKVLSAFPYIIRNKGSLKGIEMCVNTFLNIIGIRSGHTITVYNDETSPNFTVSIGIEGRIMDTAILKDMLSYVIPTGYFVEFYFYTSPTPPATKLIFNSATSVLADEDYNSNSVVSSEEAYNETNLEDETLEDDTYGTVQLTTIVANPTQEESTDGQ